jgi:hypothetical protein
MRFVHTLLAHEYAGQERFDKWERDLNCCERCTLPRCDYLPCDIDKRPGNTVS